MDKPYLVPCWHGVTRSLCLPRRSMSRGTSHSKSLHLVCNLLASVRQVLDSMTFMLLLCPALYLVPGFSLEKKTCCHGVCGSRSAGVRGAVDLAGGLMWRGRQERRWWWGDVPGAEISPSPRTRAGWPRHTPGTAPSPPRCPHVLPAQPIPAESGQGSTAQTSPAAAASTTQEAAHMVAGSRELRDSAFRVGAAESRADVSLPAPRNTRQPCHGQARGLLHKLSYLSL